MTRADYEAIRACNFSTLKHLRPPDGCPARYLWHCQTRTPETPAMLQGRLIHTAVFEPDRLLTEYSVWDGDRRGKDYAAFLEQATEQGRSVIKRDDWTECCAVRDAVRNHLSIMPLLDDGAAEVGMEWTNPDTGLRCKGRADWVGDGFILDLKTTGYGISPRAFSNHCWNMGYFMQAAMYQEAYTVLHGGEIPRMGIIAAESRPPYMVRLYWLSPAGLIAGWDEFVAALRTVRDCAAAGQWPGPDGETVLEPPAWASVEDVDYSGLEE